MTVTYSEQDSESLSERLWKFVRDVWKPRTGFQGVA